MISRKTARNWHIWLGWMVAIPVLFWFVSGIIMVIRPIEEVRGTGIIAPSAAITLQQPPVTPAVEGVPLESLTIEPRAAGPRWVAKVKDGPGRIADPATGKWLPHLSAADAAAEVSARYAGKSSIASVKATSAEDPPLEFRRPVAAWQVAMKDGTHVYVDRQTGAILATRTPFWRVYDFMWGLHIMDTETREVPHNPLTLAFGFIGLAMVILGLVLLPLTLPKKRRGSAED